MDSLPDPVIGCDVAGVVVYWSRAAETAYGYTREEAVGQPAAHPLPGAGVGDHRGARRPRALARAPGAPRQGRPVAGAEPAPAPQGIQAGDATARTLAHDLNNALAIIVNYTAFVVAELNAPTGAAGAGMRADLHEVQAAAERALELTRRLAGEL